MNKDREAAVRELYRAYGEQDGTALAQLLAEDFVLHASGNHRLSGEYRGLDAVFDYFLKVGEWTGGRGAFQVDAVMSDDDRYAAALVTRTGFEERNVEYRFVHLFMFRDGKIIEFRDLPFDQQIEDRFWTDS